MKITVVFLAAGLLPVVAGAKTIYVDNKLDDYTGHDGTSWALAYHRIQDAVKAASSGDTVLVAPGVYGDDQGTVIDKDSTGTNNNYSFQKNRIWINNKRITLKSSEGAAVTHIVGKYADTETGIGPDAVRCIALSGASSLPNTRIEGFTIRDGATVAYGTGKTYNSDGTPMSNCEASHRGGGLLFHYISSVTHRQIYVVDCVISNCVAAEGAAAYGVVLLRCRVSNNRTYREGGSATRQCNTANCIFDGNGAENYEGTLYVGTGRPIVSVNCTFFNNKGILRAFDSGYSATVLNAFLQCNGKTKDEANAYFAPVGWSGATFTNCVADYEFINGTDNVLMSFKVDNAQLVAPIYGDFRPVADPYVKNVVGKGNKEFCSPDWIPTDDQNKDFFGKARWDGENAVSVGAIQESVDVAGGCIMIGASRYTINGRLFERMTDGYFYMTNSPAQYRLRIWKGSDDPASVWCGGYYEGRRFPDLNGELVVTAPPFSCDKALYLRPDASLKTVWADPSYTGGDSDGSEQRPFTTLQAAVDATAGFSSALVKAKAGRYDSGGAYFSGNCRVVITNNNLCIRAVDGPTRTFIVGADGSPANPDGCGTNAYRCVGVNCNGFKIGDAAGVVGFTFTDGRTCSNGEDCSQYCRYSGGAYVNKSGAGAQFLDCVITNCCAVFASAAHNGWFQNCRIANCFQASNPAKAVGTTERRGVIRASYLSGCVIGPNAYGTVSIDANTALYNSTLNETSTTLHISKDAKLFNVLDLNHPTTQTAIGTTAGLCIETTSTLAHTDCVKFSDAKIAARGQGDFRPLRDSPVLVNGTTNNVPDFHRYTIGGIHGGLFPAGTPVVGASYDVATPVTVSSMRGIEISGGLGTPFVSSAHPITLTATKLTRKFNGFLVNGQLATAERTLVLLANDGSSAYTIEPLYVPAGTTMIFR